METPNISTSFWHDVSSWQTKLLNKQLYKVSTPCIDDHQFKEEPFKSVGELSDVCFQIVLKCVYLARIGRPDMLWSVNKLARSNTKWTSACDKRLARLNNIVMWATLRNDVDWDYLKILIFHKILKIRNPRQVEHCVYWEVTHLFQKVGCARSRHLCHTAQPKRKLFLSMQECEWTEFPRSIWDLVIEVLHSDSNQKTKARAGTVKPVS